MGADIVFIAIVLILAVVGYVLPNFCPSSASFSA